MPKHICHKSLWSKCSRPRHRRAFSLAELVVSIGILVLMFALAGEVFSLSIQSTGQATALTELSRLFRAFEQTLREDLAQVEPGQSVMLIQGNPVNAYWTQGGKDGDANNDPSDGYGHLSDPTRENETGDLVKPRADMLMFFTARRATSFAHAQEYPGLSSNLQQVVYGHAELGEYVAVKGSAALDEGLEFALEMPDQPTFPGDEANPNFPSPTKKSPVPAERWHLARRGWLLVPTQTPTRPPDPTANLPLDAGEVAALLSGVTDVIGLFSYDDVVLTASLNPPWFLPNIIDPGNPVPRSALDPVPPASMAPTLGHYLLPGCASFKVEWTIDPRSEFVDGRLDGLDEVIWIDPGLDNPFQAADDAVARLLASDDETRQAQGDQLWLLYHGVTNHPEARSYSLANRFLGPELSRDLDNGWPTLSPDGRPNLVVFGPGRRRDSNGNRMYDLQDEIVPEDVFPSALRITVDLFDPLGRLERPTRHVMVVPIGS